MRQLVDFLAELAENNNREWFAANKQTYLQVHKYFTEFATQFMNGVALFDASTAGLRLSDCTYRIYRDIRFSHDKSPYKTWYSIFVAPHGKKSGYAGYYLHIEPSKESFIYAGIHAPTPTLLRSVREEIIDHGDIMMQSIKACKGFELSRFDVLKRNPKDFAEPTPYDELLRMKDLGVIKHLTIDDICHPDFLQRVLADLKMAQPLVAQLNRAVDYAFEEMM